MAIQFDLSAEARTDAGKGASRRLRRAGKVPAIIYGAGKDPAAVELSHNDLKLHLEHEAFYSHILTVTCNGATEKVVLKDLQRHPYKPTILHVDFLRIDEKAKLTMRVPLHFINEESCIGVKQQGGITSHLLSEVEISCLPKDLPEYIEVDVGGLHVNQSVHFSDLKLPQGVEIPGLIKGGDMDQAVFSVHLPRGATEEGGEQSA